MFKQTADTANLVIVTGALAFAVYGLGKLASDVIDYVDDVAQKRAAK